MATCQNGYPVAFSRDKIQPDAATVIPSGATRKFTFRSDHAKAWQILLDVLHAFVESVHEGYKAVDDWSYAVRPVRGQTSGYSNHSGACACDYNSTQHPLATKPQSNFTARQIARIRECMRRFVGNGKRIFRWGGDYSGRRDPMHFEIIAKIADVLAFVRDWVAGKITLSFDTPIKPPAPLKPPAVKAKISLSAIQAGLTSGSELVEGQDGAQFQKALNAYLGVKLVADGVLGRNTRSTTARAQARLAKLEPAAAWPNKDYNSDCDGIAGRQLLTALGFDVQP